MIEIVAPIPNRARQLRKIFNAVCFTALAGVIVLMVIHPKAEICMAELGGWCAGSPPSEPAGVEYFVMDGFRTYTASYIDGEWRRTSAGQMIYDGDGTPLPMPIITGWHNIPVAVPNSL